MVDLYLNGVNVTEEYGITLGENAITTLMTPPATKAYIENESMSANGKEILVNSRYAPVRFDSRDLSLVFIIAADTQENMLESFDYLCNVLAKGAVYLKTSFDMKRQYVLYYNSCSQLQSYFNKCAKFSIKFTEPNPTATQVLEFKGTELLRGVSNTSVYNVDYVAWHEESKAFVGAVVTKVGALYSTTLYKGWSKYETYNDPDTGSPYTYKTYLDTETNKTYKFNGETLEEIA